MADDVNPMMEAENTDAEMPLSSDNVAVGRSVDVAAAGELIELLAGYSEDHEHKTHLSVSSASQCLKFPLSYKGKLLFFPKNSIIIDDSDGLSFTTQLQRLKQKLIGPHKSGVRFDFEMKPVKNETFPFMKPNFRGKFPVKYIQSLQNLWPKEQAATKHSKMTLRKMPIKKFNTEGDRKLCVKREIISGKSQTKVNEKTQREFHETKILSKQKEFVTKTTTTYTCDSTLPLASEAVVSNITQDASETPRNNKFRTQAGSDPCQPKQSTQKTIEHFAISSATANSKFPLLRRKHEGRNEFPLDSHLKEPNHPTNVDLSTLPCETSETPPNNKFCTQPASDLCHTKQSAQKTIENFAISSAAANSKFPLLRHKNESRNEFPLGSRLKEPDHPTNVDLSTLPCETSETPPNNKFRTKAATDLCQSKQSTQKTIAHFAISNATVNSKFPLLRHKHESRNEFPLGSRLKKPDHPTNVDLSTLPCANPRQQCININTNNNTNSAVKKNFTHPSRHFPTSPKYAAACTSFPFNNTPPDMLIPSPGMRPTTLNADYNVENQNSTIFSAEDSRRNGASMTQSEIFQIDNTAISAAQRRHTQNDGDGVGSNDDNDRGALLPKILAKNIEICNGQSERSNFDGRSTEFVTEEHFEERRRRPSATAEGAPLMCGARTQIHAETEHSGHANIHNLSEPLYATSSDVRDTSSQEVQRLVAAVVSAPLELCTATTENANANATPYTAPTPTSEPEQQPAVGWPDSPSLKFLSDSVENIRECDKSAQAVSFENNKNNRENHKNNSDNNSNNNRNNKNNSVSIAKNINNDTHKTNHVSNGATNINDDSTDVATPHTQSLDPEVVGRVDVEMTLTKVEESEEDNLSVSSSIVDDNQKLSDPDPPVDDMKSSNRGASNLLGSLPRSSHSSSNIPLQSHTHTYNHTPTVPDTRTHNYNHTPPVPDTRTHPPTSVGALPPPHAKPELSRYAKIEPRSVPTVGRPPPATGAYDRDDSVGSGLSRVLLAATDVSKLANFGKPRRIENAVGRTPSADAVMNSSVLPARTLLRRQRRLQLQDRPDDKPEDALERLNRLRARISASLSEVKGVLQHYSVDEGDESQTLTNAIASKTSSGGMLPKVRDAATVASLPQPASNESANLIKPTSANNASPSSPAASDEVDKQMQNEASKDEGPVVFRFVKKVRRRSFFSEDDDEQPKKIEVEVDTQRAEVSNSIVSNHKLDETDEKKVFREEEHKIQPEQKNITQNELKNKEDLKESTEAAAEHKTEHGQKQSEDKHSQQQSKIKESTTIQNKAVGEPFIPPVMYKTTDQVSEVVKEQESSLSSAESKHQEALATDAVTRTTKRSSLTKKDDARRASIAAVEASKIEPPLNLDVALDVKAQRRPSDSEAVLKKKAAGIRNLITKKVEANNATNLQLPNAVEVPPQPALDVPSKSGVELATVKEEKTSDQSEESATESKTKVSSNKVATSKETESEATAKPKRRLSAKTKDSSRRASIAAVEGSRIEPPVQTSTPLSAKTQRRPSDSEAVVKRKAFAAAAQTSNDTKPKVKIITKVKRPSVKSNASATTATAAATTNESSLANETSAPEVNNSNKDAMSQIIKTTATTTTTIAPTTAAFMKATMTATTQPTIATGKASTNNTATPAPLPTQLAIDEASLSNAAASPPSTLEKDGRTAATKDSRLAAKLDGQSDAMVATLVSPLRASEQSSQVSAATQLQQLAELLGETLIVTPTRERKDDPAARSVQLERQSENSATAEKVSGAAVSVKPEIPIAVIPKIPETLVVTSNTTTVSPQPPADIKKPIHHERIPTGPVQAPTTSEQVSGVDRESAPNAAVVGDTSLAPRIGGDRTKASATPSSSISVDEHSAASTPATATANAMPELQVVPAPVKAVQVFGETDATPPFNVPKDDYAPKKIIIKKFVRKNSIEKALSKQKSLEKATTDTQSQKKIAPDSVKPIEHVELHPEPATTKDAAFVAGDEAPAVDESGAPAPSTKKARKVRKKVIIKRQQRKLSITDTFFKEPEPSDAELPAVETLEKPIEYVTDEDDDDTDNANENVEPVVEPAKPLKSCMKPREYQLGDWVLYGERFKKTQIRWKKGQIVERITSISYKIDVDGKEVSAHISYIKKYTSRKVKFSGKEYLEIDYEQIAEEEKRARSYSIWNMA